jgi:opacity protein-like surface antigen
MKHFLLVVGFGLFSFNVHSMESKVYLGGGIGETDFDEGRLIEGNSDPVSSNTDGQTIKIYGGYRFNQFIVLEGQYSDYADVVYSNHQDSSKDFTIGLENYSLALNVGYQFNFGLRPFVTAGVGRMRVELDSQAENFSTWESSYRLGAGLEYTPTMLPDVSFRLAYESDSFDVKDSTSNDSYSIASTYLGVSYNF